VWCVTENCVQNISSKLLIILYLFYLLANLMKCISALQLLTIWLKITLFGSQLLPFRNGKKKKMRKQLLLASKWCVYCVRKMYTKIHPNQCSFWLLWHILLPHFLVFFMWCIEPGLWRTEKGTFTIIGKFSYVWHNPSSKNCKLVYTRIQILLSFSTSFIHVRIS